MRIASQVLPSAIDPGFQHHAALMTMLGGWPTLQRVPHLHPDADRPRRGIPQVSRRRRRAAGREDPGLRRGRRTGQGLVLPDEEDLAAERHSPRSRGFPLRVKNFAVGEVNMFSAEQGYSYNIHEHQELKTASRLAWFCGEIHVTNNDIKPNTPGTTSNGSRPPGSSSRSSAGSTRTGSSRREPTAISIPSESAGGCGGDHHESSRAGEAEETR